jgi:HK97 family phage portal protein
MRWLDRFKLAWRSITLDDFPQLKGLLVPPVAAGVAVTQQTANNVSAYWNGVSVIAGDIGVLDRHLYRRVGDDERERATSHQVYKLVHDQPNPYMTPQVFWETLASHAVSWGNGYAEIEWDNALRPIALWPITPDKIDPVCAMTIDARGRKRAELYYRYAGKDRIEFEDVIHVPGLGFDGIRGYSPVTLARQSLGLSLAAEQFGASFFGNGAWPGLALEHPGSLTAGAQERLRDSINQMHQSSNKAHRLMILEEGMKASKPITIPPDDAQFLETRLLQIEEIARWLNIPPHKLKHKIGERPGGNFESSEIDYQVTTLLPWTTRIEQECNRKLIPASQRGTYYIEHLFAKRLQVDTATRTAAQKIYYDMGVLSKAQIAKQENLPAPEEKPDSLSLTDKIESLGQLIRAGFDPAAAAKALGLPAIKHLGTLPVTPAVPEPPAAPADQPPPEDDQASSLRALLYESLSRYVRRECGRVGKAAEKDPQAFGAWVEEFYGRERGVLGDVLEPFVRYRLAQVGWGGDPEMVTRGIAGVYLERSKDQLLALPAKDRGFEAERLVERWEKSRTAELVDEIMALGADKEEGHAA